MSRRIAVCVASCHEGSSRFTNAVIQRKSSTIDQFIVPSKGEGRRPAKNFALIIEFKDHDLFKKAFDGGRR
jgi:hypothetical protein